ncbi:FAD-binding molybdopterin dehydrogenase [Kitasatospora herbaricolor]|uniref:FAD binding domain-containing protein n=1 Tax=Kitasatospora herbaricolor TaxID=68217 RepID=UPI0017483033|nr:xanthine dehydrogenase family protein subunit M [Kitasatospora herbaricolor]MDQ0312635.1 xanthine dehydrogenase YagS FAD-binding subunit [Kitasatospora herbaricolor]GGV38638.1 FAD-binding molybdopterin dehydrogenase [Kitasatospora herbaricolor]
MREFGYLRPTGVAEAVELLAADPGARYLAGGTNLVDLMKLGVERPRLLVDLGRLPLRDIGPTGDGGLRIGALARNADLAADPRVRASYPVLSQALLAGASGQLRNVATTAGNLLQRTRCPYFQDTAKPCNKRLPGTGCPAREGVHRDLAVLGASEHCVATHPSDLAVALAVLDATVELLGPDGARTLPVTDLHRLPGDRPDLEHRLLPGELITAVTLPPPAPGARSAYRKARDRASYAFALASVAAVLVVRGSRVERVGIAFGGLAAKPWRARTAEAMLLGASADEASFRAAAEAELAAARPLRDNGHKVPLARNLAVRVLSDLALESVR